MTQTTWKNGISDIFDNPARWSAGVPGSTDDALITATGTYTVTVQSSDNITVAGLATAKGATLLLDSGSTFWLQNGSDGLTGAKGTSAGTIEVDGVALTTILEIGNNAPAGSPVAWINTGKIKLDTGSDELLINGAVNMTGGGGVSLSGGLVAGVAAGGSQGPAILTTSNNFSGFGQLGDANLTLSLSGRVQANGGTLNIEAASVSNSGVIGQGNTGTINIFSNVTQTTFAAQIRGTTGGTSLIGDTVTGGQVVARGNGTIVNLEGATLAGVSLDTTGTGIIQTQGVGSATDILDGSTNAVLNTGNLSVLDGGTLELIGHIRNNPTFNSSQAISLNSTGDLTQLLTKGAVSLTDGGNMTLSNNSGNSIDTTGSVSDSLASDNNISGAGSIGSDDGFALTNTGNIVNGPSDSVALQINLGATLTNSSGGTLGNLEALGSGGLDIVNTAVVGGNAAVGDGSTLTLDNGDAGTSGVAFSFYDPTFSFAGTLVSKIGGPSGTNPFGSGSTIAGFAGNGTNSDVIDLTALTFKGTTTAIFGGGVLAVTEGTRTFDISLIGGYSSGDFTLKQDSGSGTEIIVANTSNVVTSLPSH
jgi:hypothetical protein